MFTHWQNLTDSGHGWRAGRAWLHTAKGRVFGIEWKHFSKCSGALSLSLWGVEDLMTIHVGIPFLLSWFLSVSGSSDFDKEKELSIRFFDFAVWWSIWMHPDNWNSTDPKWRRGNWRPIDSFLGRQKYHRQIVNEGETSITMPEGNYKASYQECIDSWKRPRAFRPLIIRRFSIDLIEPIPEPGKGTMPYNIEDTALESMTVACDTLEEAIARVKEASQRSRGRYGGLNWKPSD